MRLILSGLQCSERSFYYSVLSIRLALEISGFARLLTEALVFSVVAVVAVVEPSLYSYKMCETVGSVAVVVVVKMVVLSGYWVFGIAEAYCLVVAAAAMGVAVVEVASIAAVASKFEGSLKTHHPAC